jgi:hypothetical protein
MRSPNTYNCECIGFVLHIFLVSFFSYCCLLPNLCVWIVRSWLPLWLFPAVMFCSCLNWVFNRYIVTCLTPPQNLVYFINSSSFESKVARLVLGWSSFKKKKVLGRGHAGCNVSVVDSILSGTENNRWKKPKGQSRKDDPNTQIGQKAAIWKKGN